MIDVDVDVEREAWFKDHVGIFSGSQAIRLLSGIGEEELLKGDKLDICVDAINELTPESFSESSGLPYTQLVNLMVDEEGIMFSAKEVKYAFKSLNPLSKGLKGYAKEKAIEMLTEFSIPKQLRSKDVLNGIARESEAVGMLSEKIGRKIDNTTDKDAIFLRLDNPSCDLGATTDGNIFNGMNIEATVEAKCCSPKVHYSYLGINSGKDLLEVEPKYYAQVQTEIICAEADYGYFCVFNPEFTKKDYRFSYCKIEKDEDYCKGIIKRATLATEYRNSYMKIYEDIK